MDDSSNATGDRAYFAQRAAEELDLAMSAADQEAAEAHRRLQRVYTERASVGARITAVSEEVG
jgi:hypothetical protein